MTPPPVSIADLVGSSKYAAIADDSLKDEDNAAWVMFLPPEVAADWIEVISWLRLIDRMAENEWLEGWGSRLQIFRIGWRALLVTGQVLPDDYHADLLTKMHRRWFTGKRGVMDWSPIHAWDEYVDAISEYHRSDMVFETIEEYERMLSRLGGSLLQVCPLLSDSQRLTVRAFGVMDQFFNQLRDLEEDTAQNLCYFPADVLDRFGVDRQELIDRSCFKNDGYHRMMRFWLDKGVDGFRLDIISAIYEDPMLQDNPFSYKIAPSDNSLTIFFQHLKNNFLQEDSFGFATELRKVLEEYPNKFMVGETHGDESLIHQFCKYKQENGLHTVFLFKAITTSFNATAYRKMVEKFEKYFPEPLIPTYVFGNHDRTRHDGAHPAPDERQEGVRRLSFGPLSCPDQDQRPVRADQQPVATP